MLKLTYRYFSKGTKREGEEKKKPSIWHHNAQAIEKRRMTKMETFKSHSDELILNKYANKCSNKCDFHKEKLYASNWVVNLMIVHQEWPSRASCFLSNENCFIRNYNFISCSKTVHKENVYFYHLHSLLHCTCHFYRIYTIRWTEKFHCIVRNFVLLPSSECSKMRKMCFVVCFHKCFSSGRDRESCWSMNEKREREMKKKREKESMRERESEMKASNTKCCHQRVNYLPRVDNKQRPYIINSLA